eukprot:6030619-Alexandrium_andersonii.AAC.1
MSRFLNSHDNLERLKRTCLTGARQHLPLARVRCKVDWRWGSIMRTISGILLNESTLRTAWSQA